MPENFHICSNYKKKEFSLFANEFGLCVDDDMIRALDLNLCTTVMQHVTQLL